MSRSRRSKPKNLLRQIERLRLRAGERRLPSGKRIRKGQYAQDSFAEFYLD